MTKILIFGLLFAFTTRAHALFESIHKYKLKANNEIYEGYEKDDSVFLYKYNQSLQETRFAASDIIFSTRSILDGVQAGQTVLLRTPLSAMVACTVETVFLDQQLSVFCDEYTQVKNQLVPARRHYRPMTTQVEKEIKELGNIKKEQTYAVAQDTELFKSGSQVRVIHLYANGMAIVEPGYRQLLNRTLPEHKELISIKALQ